MKHLPKRLQRGLLMSAESVKAHPYRWTAGVSTTVIAFVAAWFFVFAAVTVTQKYKRLSESIKPIVPDDYQVSATRKKPDIGYVSKVETPIGTKETIADQPMSDVAAPILVDRFIVQLKSEATKSQLEKMLGRLSLRIVGGIPEIGLLFLAPQYNEYNRDIGQNNLEALTNLRREKIVLHAAADLLLKPNILPANSEQLAHDGHGEEVIWDWSNRIKGNHGNWGQKIIRLPTAWTIFRKGEQRNGDSDQFQIAVVDSGFKQHEDIDYSQTFEDQPGQICKSGSEHGNHIAGVIAAKFDNKLGINGVMPSANIIAKSVPLIRPETHISRDQAVTAMSHAMVAVENLILSDKDKSIQLINLSLGYNLGSFAVSASFEDDGEFASSIFSLKNITLSHLKRHEELREDILFVSAAGNDSGPGLQRSAELASPYNVVTGIATSDPLPNNVVVVEASTKSDGRWIHSNKDGHVSAPGEGIMSTGGSTSNSYTVCTGTSMAAPFVTGLAAMMKRYDPSLSNQQLKDTLISTGKNLVGGGAPRIDALEAFLAIGQQSLVDLADLNNDGNVDNVDLTIFAGHVAALQSELTTYNSDFNGDLIVDSNEHHWPISDLNGSGKVSIDNDDRMPLMGKSLRDIDILKLAWTPWFSKFPSEVEIQKMIADSN